MGPLFARGEAVWYKRLGKKGVIEGIINIDDPADARRQGYRYTLKVGTDLWSVPESQLADRDTRFLKKAARIKSAA